MGRISAASKSREIRGLKRELMKSNEENQYLKADIYHLVVEVMEGKVANELLVDSLYDAQDEKRIILATQDSMTEKMNEYTKMIRDLQDHVRLQGTDLATRSRNYEKKCSKLVTFARETILRKIG